MQILPHGFLHMLAVLHAEADRRQCTVPIRQVVCSRPISYAGVEAIQYLCKTQLGQQEALLELRYTVRTHRWTLFRVVYGCPG